MLVSLVVVIAAAMALFVNVDLRADSTQEMISMANIEALANENEEPGDGGSSSQWSCWSAQKSGSGYWRCGNPCQWVDDFGGSGPKSKCAAN